MDGIVTKKTTWLDLKGGGKVEARQLGRAKFEACMAAAGSIEENDGAKLMLMQHVVRASIVKAADTPEEWPALTHEKHPMIGSIVGEDFYDALSSEDCVEIFRFAQGGISEKAAGN